MKEECDFPRRCGRRGIERGPEREGRFQKRRGSSEAEGPSEADQRSSPGLT